MDIEQRVKDLQEQERLAEEKILKTKTMPLTIADAGNSSLMPYKDDVREDNALVSALLDTTDAVEMARASFKDIKNQKDIANKMGKIVKEKTNADLDTAHLQVKDQEVGNKIKQAEQRNRLIQLNAEKKFLEKEAKHKLAMQKFKQMKEKNYDLLLKYFRAKHKDANGKWVYENDAAGNPIIHMPSKFSLALVRFFDGFTTTLNQIADAVSGLNKVVFKGGLIILLLLFIFVPPFRDWILNLIKFT